MPTDWTTFVVFNKGSLQGSIILSSWVEEYTESDKVKIDGIWQPTSTYYGVDPAVEAFMVQ